MGLNKLLSQQHHGSSRKWEGECRFAMPCTAELAECGIEPTEEDLREMSRVFAEIEPDPDLEAWYEAQAKKDEEKLENLPF